MGLGREVADAYIEVHGDLTDFRRDLEKVEGQMEALAKKNAKTFEKAMDGLKAEDFKKKWSDMVSAMHSGEQLDFQRLIKSFDPHDLDEAEAKLTKFMKNMAERHKLTGDAYKATKKAILDNIDLMREEEAQQQRLNEITAAHAEALRDNEAWMKRRADTMAEAIKDNEAWARTFEGIRKNDTIKRMNDDFEKLSKIMKDADVDKFMKGFSSFDEMRGRVNEVTDAMREMGRISKDNSDEIRAQVNLWIFAREEEIRLEGEALAAARRLREEQEAYARSLDGMVQAAHFKKVEADFKDLTDAIGTADFSKFGKGAKDLQEFRDRVIETAGHMREFGKINDEEFGKIISHLDKVSLNLGDFNVQLESAGKRSVEVNSGLTLAGAAAEKLADSVEAMLPKMGGLAGAAKSLAGHMGGTLSHFRGLAGLNVLGDLIDQGIDLAVNIDRVALNMSTSALKIGSAASLILAAGGGLVNVMADMASMANIGLLAPAFITSAGIQIGVLVAAFKDMKEVLKDLGPQFSALQDSISENFWAKVEGPVRSLVDDTFPSLKRGMEGTATALGGMFAEIAQSLEEIDNAKIDTMFDRMNKSIVTGTKAVKPLMNAIGTLAEVGSQYFDRFANWIVDLSEDFNKFITDAAADGRLNQWIEDAIEGFKNTGRAIGGVVEIFEGINQAAEAAGLGGLKEFADGLERMADITKSPEFQTALTSYFEGAKAGADQIMDAIDSRLFPALGDIAPTMSTAMDIIGEAMGKAIGYVADIIENPRVQEGILALTNGVNNAMTTIEGAVGPIGDSLGSLLDISGHIIENVAKIATTFMIHVGPQVDMIGRKFEELADPLTGAITQGIKDLTPVIESLRLNFVNPLVDGLKKILPEIQTFVTNIAPDLKSLSDTIGPAFKKLAEEVLPKVVSFATQLADSVLIPVITSMVQLLTPAFGTALTEVGKGMGNMAEGMKALKGEANNFKWPWSDLPNPQEDLKAKWGQQSDNTFWDDLGKVIFGGNLADMGQRAMEAWNDDFSRMWEWLATNVGQGFQRIWEGKIFGDQPGKFFSEIFSDEGNAEISDAVNQWFEDLGTKISEAWNGFWDSIFGGGGDEESGGGHFAGRSAGGKITPEMIGLGEPEEGWLEGTINSVRDSISGFFETIGSGFAEFFAPIVEGWNGFWNGLGTIVGEVWTNITTTLSTWWTTITTNITTWWTNLKTGWDTFWAQLPVIVQQIWTTVTTWISTKVQEIATNIGNFITTVRTNWDNFWNTVNTKVQQIWQVVTTWISTKVGEIRTNISNFITTVRTSWDSFWNSVNQKVQAIWGVIVSWIAGKVGEIRTNISNFTTTVRTTWDTFWTNVRTTVDTAWQNLVTAVSTGVDNVMGFIRGLPGQISGALGGLGDLLTGAGDAIMGGLKRGIEAGFEAVKNVVGGIAGWIRDNKGPISYDRVLLIPAGQAIMSGLREGIEDGFRPLKSTLEDITAGMVDSVVEGVGRGKMYAAGAAAALGFTDGLSAQGSSIAAAFDALLPSLDGSVTVGGSTGVGVPTPVAAGAGTTIYNEVTVTTRAQSPEAVGSIVGDTLDELAASFSTGI